MELASLSLSRSARPAASVALRQRLRRRALAQDDRLVRAGGGALLGPNGRPEAVGEAPSVLARRAHAEVRQGARLKRLRPSSNDFHFVSYISNGRDRRNVVRSSRPHAVRTPPCEPRFEIQRSSTVPRFEC